MKMLPVSYQSFLFAFYIRFVSAVVSNGSSQFSAASITAATIPQISIANTAQIALSNSLSNCTYCEVISDNVGFSAWSRDIKTYTLATILLVHDNSKNATTSTSTIQRSNLDLINADDDVVLGTVKTEHLAEVIKMTYPTQYNIYQGFTKWKDFPVHVTLINGTSSGSFLSCKTTSTVYTNAFAIPVVEDEGNRISGPALSRYQSFSSSIYGDFCCRRHGSVVHAIEQNIAFELAEEDDTAAKDNVIGLHVAALDIQPSMQAVLTLTATSTSIRSSSKTPTAKPAPSPKPEAPTPLPTEPAPGLGHAQLPDDGNQLRDPKTKPNPPSESNTNGPSQPASNSPIKIIADSPNQPDYQPGSKPPSEPQLGRLSQSEPVSNPPKQKTQGQLDSKQLEKIPAPQPEQTLAPRPVITIGSKPYTANPSSQFVIGDQTLNPGGPLVSVAGIPISLAQFASHVVIGGSTINLSPSQPSKLLPLTLGGSVVVANSASQFIIGGQTLTPGKELVVSGTSFSLAPSGKFVVAAHNTISISPALPSHPVLTAGGLTVSANSASQFIIGSQTLKPDGPEITVSGTPISLAPSATEAVVAGNTIPLIGPSAAFFALPDKVITPDSASQYVIDGQTLAPGSAIIVAGTPISLAPSASEVIVGTKTIPLLKPSLGSLPPLTIGDRIITANSESQYVVDGKTLVPGSSAITISGTPISIAPSASNIVIGGTTLPLTIAPTPLPVLTIAGKTISPNGASEYIIGSQTLIPGASAITVSGTRISLAASASALIIGTTTIPLTAGASRTTPLPNLTINGHIITPNAASQYIIGSQTLIPGGPAITVSGTRISLAASASALIIGTTTIPLTPTFLPPLTIAGHTITPNAASQYIIGDKTLIPGGPAITISGTRISLAASASALIIGSTTIPLTTTPLPPLTIAGHTITPNAASQYIIGSQTLIPGGPAITVSGTRISLAPQATDVAVAGGSTLGLGKLILGGLDGSAVGALPSRTAQVGGGVAESFRGGAERVARGGWGVGAVVVVVGVGAVRALG